MLEVVGLKPPGPSSGPLEPGPWGDWKGFPPEGTLSRRPGVREPATYMLCDLVWDEPGDIMGPHLGLFCPVEKVAEVGVLKSLGEGGRYSWPSGARYGSIGMRDRGSAITRGGGLRRASLTLYVEAIELALAMLDVDSDLACPRPPGPTLPPVDALALPVCRTLSVRICR